MATVKNVSVYSSSDWCSDSLNVGKRFFSFSKKAWAARLYCSSDFRVAFSVAIVFSTMNSRNEFRSTFK